MAPRRTTPARSRRRTPAKTVVRYRTKTAAAPRRRRRTTMGAKFSGARIKAGLMAGLKGMAGGAAVHFAQSIGKTEQDDLTKIGIGLGVGVGLAVITGDTAFAAGAGGALATTAMSAAGLNDQFDFLQDDYRTMRNGGAAAPFRLKGGAPLLQDGVYPGYSGVAQMSNSRMAKDLMGTIDPKF